MDNNKSPDVKCKSGKRFLVIYSVSLFIFAGVLILLSFLSQNRMENEADEIKRKLTDKTVMAENAQARLNNISKSYEEQIHKLSEKIKALEEENKNIKETTVPELNKKIKAYDFLLKIVATYEKGNLKECKKLIEEFKREGFVDILPDEAYLGHGSIEKMIKG